MCSSSTTYTLLLLALLLYYARLCFMPKYLSYLDFGYNFNLNERKLPREYRSTLKRLSMG